jgi:hypothetical protein
MPKLLSIAGWLIVILIVASCEDPPLTGIPELKNGAAETICLAQMDSGSLEVVRLDASYRRTAVDTKETSDWPFSGRVSPLGSYILGQTRAGLRAIEISGATIWNVAGFRPLGMPSISRDESLVALSGEDGALAVLTTADRATKVLDVRGKNAAMAPDGGRLAFDDGQNTFIYVLATKVTTELGSGTEPSWSNNSSAVAVRTRANVIELIDVTTRRRQLFLEASSSVSVPKWSPGGEWAMFTRRGPRSWLSKAEWQGAEPTQIVIRDLRTGRETSVGQFYKANRGDYAWVLSREVCNMGH